KTANILLPTPLCNAMFAVMDEKQSARGEQIGPEALKGLAHPLRVAIFDELSTFGPQTATRLAQRLGESSGATSYHLRQLARHGFIRVAEGMGSRREK